MHEEGPQAPPQPRMIADASAARDSFSADFCVAPSKLVPLCRRAKCQQQCPRVGTKPPAPPKAVSGETGRALGTVFSFKDSVSLFASDPFLPLWARRGRRGKLQNLERIQNPNNAVRIQPSIYGKNYNPACSWASPHLFHVPWGRIARCFASCPPYRRRALHLCRGPP
jgi:hypothetical protein